MQRTIFLLVFLLSTAMHGSRAQTVRVRANNLDSLLTYCEQTVGAQPAAVIACGQALVAYGDQHTQPRFTAYGHYWQGKAFRLSDSTHQALAHLEKSVSFFRKHPEPRGLCLNLKEIGVVYYLQGDPTQAMDYYTEALSLAVRHNLAAEKIALNNNIGNLYDNQQHYDKALLHYREALSANPDKKIQITLLQNIARVNIGLRKLDQALADYRGSASLSEALHDSLGLLSALGGVASVYWEQERYDEVLTISADLLKMQRQRGATADVVETLNRIGVAYLNLQESREAIRYFNDAWVLARTIAYTNRYRIRANLAFAYEQTGNYKQAYQHFVAFKQHEDSVVQAGKEQQLEEQLARYEADKQEQKILLLQREKELQTVTLQKQLAELDRSRLTRNIVLLVALLLVVLVVVLLALYRQRTRSRQLLAARTEEVNRQRTLDLIREHELKTMLANLEGRDMERLRIAQELHDGVAGSLAGIKLHMRKLSDTLHAPELEKVIRNVDSLYEEVRTISHDMHPHKVLNTAFIDLIRSHLKQTAEQGSFAVEFICHPEEQLNKLPDAVKIEVYRILQEVMANIQRHAQASAVEVQFTRTEESVNLIVEDFGKGFDRERIHFGVGLNSIQRRVSDIRGTLHIESVVGRGTIVNIDIPVL